MKKLSLPSLLPVLLACLCADAPAQGVCGRVSEIKRLPFKDERVEDDAYNALVAAGDAAVPCLIAKVTDARRMRDPRSAPAADTRVGDVAYFVLVRITRLDFTRMLPPAVRERYKTEGVYAYFEFVRKPRSRRLLRRNLEDWYRQTHAGRADN